MKNVTDIRDLKTHIGDSVTLAGWVFKNRPKGKLIFLTLRDGTGLCQCLIERNEQTEAFFEDAKHLYQEAAVTLRGDVSADERAIGGCEVRVTDLTIVHNAEGFPITPKPHGVEFLMNHRHLWFRSRRQSLIMRIRSTLIDAIRSYFNSNGFVLFDTPIFSGSAGEGASTLFEVDYFEKQAYLAQTGQLHVEAGCMTFGKVYCFGPTFRAEKSKTRRHLTEFWMVEPEIAFADLDEVIELAEDFVCSIVQRILADHRNDLVELERDVAELERVEKPFDRIRYAEAADLLRGPKAKQLLENDLAEKTVQITLLEKRITELEEQAKSAAKQWQKDKAAQDAITAREQLAELTEQVRNIPHHMKLATEFQVGTDLGGSDETIISRLHERPVFVTHYPREVKAFYMRQDRSDPSLVENFDLLAPEGVGEIIGGSAREEDLDRLIARMDEHNLPHEAYEWYLDLRRYGSVPHGGFGLGVERTLAWICGLKHIRETIPYPRLIDTVYP